MKNKIHSSIELIEFPITVLAIGYLLLGMGSIFTSDDELLISILSIIKYSGRLIINYFPFILVISCLGKAQQEATGVVCGIFGYLIFNLITMFFGNQTFSECYYLDIFGLSNGAVKAGIISGKPLNSGIISSIIIIIVVNEVYKLSRKRLNYGIFRFISNDVLTFLVSMLLISVIAVGYVYVAPWVIQFIENLMTIIADGKLRMIYLFFYGVLERILELFGLSNITKTNFWIGNYGGIVVDTYGNTVAGDVNIWTQVASQTASNIGTGRFITPYYLFNIFIVPASVISIISVGNNRIEKAKMVGVGLFIIAVSLLSGSLWPVELWLLVTAPVLLLSWLLMSGVVYAICQHFNLCLGYSFTGSIDYAIPGNLKDFISYAGSIDYSERCQYILIAGIVFALIYVLLIVGYFYFIRPVSKRSCHNLIQCFGGIDNIKMCNSWYGNLSILVFDERLVNTENIILETGTQKIVNTHYGYRLSYGTGSIKMCNMIRKEMKMYDNIKAISYVRKDENGRR